MVAMSLVPMQEISLGRMPADVEEDGEKKPLGNGAGGWPLPHLKPARAHGLRHVTHNSSVCLSLARSLFALGSDMEGQGCGTAGALAEHFLL